MNRYFIYDEAHYSTILYVAIAQNENQVRDLALKQGINLDSLTIELDKINPKDELGRLYPASIWDAQVK